MSARDHWFCVLSARSRKRQSCARASDTSDGGGAAAVFVWFFPR